MEKMDVEECRLNIDFKEVLSRGYNSDKSKDTLKDLRQVIHKYNRNGWLEHLEYYNTIRNKKDFNYVKMRKFLQAQYKHTDYFRFEEMPNLSKNRDVYKQILMRWKKHLRSAMITYTELKKQHDYKVQHHRKTHLTEKIKCTCGKMISRGNILKHKNTKAHRSR